MATGISVKLPLRVTAEDGPYALNKDLVETTKQNFKNLVLTNPGERIMDINFGVGASALLFENYSSDTKERIRARIVEQVKTYMPFLKINSINFDDSSIDANQLFIAINYYISPLNFQDILSINLNGEQI
tara:strand:+ start:181 stop:570 length:390 start_codon:yes stop_codon:yes gene_type:complete